MIWSLLRIPIHQPSSSECFRAIQKFLSKAFALALTGIVYHNGWEKISYTYAPNLCSNHSISKRRLRLYLLFIYSFAHTYTSNTQDLGHESVQKHLRNESDEWNGNLHQTKEVSTELFRLFRIAFATPVSFNWYLCKKPQNHRIFPFVGWFCLNFFFHIVPLHLSPQKGNSNYSWPLMNKMCFNSLVFGNPNLWDWWNVST